MSTSANHSPVPPEDNGQDAVKTPGGDSTPDSDATANDAENGDSTGEKRGPRSVGLWHPDLAKTRKDVVVRWFLMTLSLCVAIMGVLSLYWGALFRVNENMRSLVIYVVDFDGQADPYKSVSPIVGPLVTGTAEQLLSGSEPSLGYTVLPAAHFNYDPFAVRKAVYDWKCYAAIYVNANATALLQEAVATGNKSYNPIGSMQLIMQTARDETTFEAYIMPQLTTFTANFAAAFGPMWAERVASNSSLTRANLAAASAAVNPGILPMMLDLRPFQPQTAVPSVTVGLIYLIIMAFFSFGFFLPIHSKYIIPRGHAPLHFWQFIIWRLVATMTTYFFISLAYSLVSLAFGVPFWPPPTSHVEPPPTAAGATAYGRGSFPVYWMINYAGMAALGLACENAAMIIGQPWTALWLIFWVITNVSTSFYSLDLSPGFYKWGRAWPLAHVVNASRSVIFDLKSDIGLDFGVLFAWVAVDVLLFPLCCYVMRWKQQKAQRGGAH